MRIGRAAVSLCALGLCAISTLTHSFAAELPVDQAVMVSEIRIDGGEFIEDSAREAVLSPYRGRMLTMEDLLNIAQGLTAKLIEAGYVNSGVIVPDQQVVNGEVHLRVVRGRVAIINVVGNRYLGDRYLKSRLETDDDPFNINATVARLQVLERNPRIRRLHAELRPGAERGFAVLDVKVEEERPYGASVGVDNYISPNVGALQTVFDAYDLSVFGQGDALSANYRRAEGFSGGSAQYAFPITARDMTIKASFDHNNSRIVSDPFAQLDIKGTTTRYGIALRQPLIASPKTEWSVELGVQREHVESFLLGEPFSFSAADADGVSEFDVAEVTQEWVRRSVARVVALRTTVSYGSGSGRGARGSGDFWEFMAQAEWLQKLPWWESTLGVKAQLHVGDDGLPAYRKYSLGGVHSVRGYRENLFTRDSGVSGSIEWSIPVTQVRLPWFTRPDESTGGPITVGPFIDYGYGWNYRSPNRQIVDLAGAGLGAQWRVGKNSNVEVYWAKALIEHTLPTTNRVLQDDGVHFAVRLGF